MLFWNDCPARIEEEKPLRELNTWRIGGAARFYAEIDDREELAAARAAAERRGIRTFILGGGSNLLITDGILDGLVIRLNQAGRLGGLQILDAEEGLVRAGAAAPLASLLNMAAEQGLAGLEDLTGIPGTVGGAVCMNAGNPARGIGAFVDEVTAVDAAGRLFTFGRDSLHFDYRWSNLEELAIVDALLRLRPATPEKVKNDMRGFLELKRRRQPLEERSAGCVFRNPHHAPAGLLIEQAGLKGYRRGDAMVSEVHANFIINAGNATCDDVRRVIDHVREEVRRLHRIDLQLEIKLWL